MRTLTATEVAQIIVCILLIIMIVIGIIKICMNWYNSNSEDDGYDEMRDNIIASSLNNHENHKAEANERLRLDIAAQIAAGLHANHGANKLNCTQITDLAFKQADMLLRGGKKTNPPSPKGQ